MPTKTKHLDTSDELHLYRYGKGIKLVRPDELEQLKACPMASDTGQTVAGLMQLPVSFYFLDAASTTEKINSEGIEVCGFQSETESIGKSLLAVSKKESAVSLIQNCNQVMQSRETRIFEEFNLRKDGITQQFLSIKAPWYDQQDRIVGVCGFSIVLGRHPLADTLTTISRLGLLNNGASQQQASTSVCLGVQLTKRESEVLRLTVKGHTAKKIARFLQLSHRTVEEYLANIKIKLGVATKSDLIALASEHFV